MASDEQERAVSESGSRSSRRSSIDNTGEAGTAHEGDSANISHYIASLHLERSNTKAGAASTLMRRKTLNKQARDPKTDQAALEREIKHVERLASLLGRRQTRFKHKLGKVKVNHDLDETLDGFFDVYEDEKVEDMLLNVGTRQTADKEDGDDPADPELKQQNIRAASTALIVSHQESQLDFAEDPFDKIEAMNLKKSPSGSVEYLPIDEYVAGSSSEGAKATAGIKTEAAATTAAPVAAVSSTNSRSPARVVGGKVISNANADLGAGALDSDDDLEASINRSNTWKRQSVMLIQEREKYGPALPRIADDGDDESSESESELSISEMSGSASENGESDIDEGFKDNTSKIQAGTGSMAPRANPRQTTSALSAKEPVAAAFYSQKTPTSAGIANRGVISDYLDILDFMDSSDSPVSEMPQLPVPSSDNNSKSIGGSDAIRDDAVDEKKVGKSVGQGDDDDDGHVSSDPSRNSDSSEIELSENNDSSDSDSDSHYFSRLGTQRTFKVANVLSSEESCNAKVDGKQQLAPAQDALNKSASVGSAGVKQPNELKTVADNAGSSQASSLLAGRSTLRRNRRVLGKGRPLRYGSLSSKLGAPAHPAPTIAVARSADASVRTSVASDVGIEIGAPHMGSQGLKQGLAHPPEARKASSVAAASIASAATTASSRSGKTAVANSTAAAAAVAEPNKHKQSVSSADGLAKLAGEAVAAASQLSAARGTRAAAVQPSNTWGSKPLPVAPDRVVRTMEVADAVALSRPKTAHGPLPPLPQKERPQIPKELAESGLDTRAEASAAMELPSSRTLFEASGRPSSLSQSRRMSVQHLHMHGVAPAHQPLPLYQHQRSDGKPESAGVTLEEWLRRTDMLLPSNNHVEKPSPFPPGNEGKQTFNTYYYVPADRLSTGSASPGVLSQSNSEIGSLASKARNSSRPSTANDMRTKGRVVRTVTLVPPSIPTASSRRSFSSASSIHSSASHQPFSLSNSPLHSRANSPFGSHRVSITSTVSIPTSTHSIANSQLEHDLEPSSTTAYAQATTASTSSPKKFFSDPKSMNNPPHTYVASADAPYGAYVAATPGFLQPNVLSAPPGDNEPLETADAPAAEGFAEPSAPMLLEPTAPELPGQWGAAATYATTYAFPMPMPAYYDPAAYGYPAQGVAAALSPQANMGFAVPMPLSMVAQQPVYQQQAYLQQAYQQQAYQQQQHVVTVPTSIQSPTTALLPVRPLPQTPPAHARPKIPSTQRPRPQSVPDEQQLHQRQQQEIPPPIPPKSLPAAPKQQNSADQSAVVSPPPTYEHSQKASGENPAGSTAAPSALASVTSPCPSDFVIV
ncbi:hypothetical protein LPJ56_001291, partial [Coemansia sp. RSA 2599]